MGIFMNWKDACSKSNLQKAIRNNQWYVYIKQNDGSEMVVNKSTNKEFYIDENKIQGYTDWKPYNG